MKKILLALLLVGLTQYSAKAWPRNVCSNCYCVCHTKHAQQHAVTVHKKKVEEPMLIQGKAYMATNSLKYMPVNHYVVYNRVHMSNKLVCRTEKEVVPDEFSSIMSPVVTTTTAVVCENKPYWISRPVVTEAVYK